MKTQTGSASRVNGNARELAVEGLFAGLVGGVGMMVALILTGFVDGASILESLARFDPAGNGAPLNGLLAHLAVSGIYGMLFAILYGLATRSTMASRLPLWLAGGVFGLILLLVALFLLPLEQSGLLAFSTWSLTLGHILYGVLVGAVMNRIT